MKVFLLSKTENRTFESIKSDTGYSYYKDGKREKQTVRILAHSIKDITVKKGSYLSAKDENTGFYYPSKRI